MIDTTSGRRDDSMRSIVESSRLWRALSAFLTCLIGATETSHAAARVRRARDFWQSIGWRARRRALAVALISAGMTHLALNAGFATPAGRFWLALPLAAMAVGGLLLVCAPSADRSEATL